MRFNKKVELYKVSKKGDGQGGRIEDKSLYKSIYCNLSLLSLEKQIQLFGVANYESYNLTTIDTIDIDIFYALIDGQYYKPTHKPKRIKNKTYVTLDRLEHAN